MCNDTSSDLCGLRVPLIVASKINGRATLQGQFRHATHLLAIVGTARIFPPRGFLSVAQQIRTAHMMEVAHFATAQPAEKRLRHVRASAGLAVKETKASVTNKLARGTFPATFLLGALAALELDGIRLEDV